MRMLTGYLIRNLMLGAALAGALVLMGLSGDARAAAPIKVTRLVPAQPSQVAPDQVSVLIFFDFTPASRALFQRLTVWADTAGGEVVLDREPLVSAGKAPLARAFVVARTLGVTRAVLPALFDLAASQPRATQTGGGASLEAAIADIFKSVGINGIEFQVAWNSSTSDDGLQHARAMAERFAVQATPRVIVNGLWKLAPGAGANADEMIAALDRQVNLTRLRITAE